MPDVPVQSSSPLPSAVNTANVLNPEIVPGGILDAGQWRHAQDAIKQLGDTLNLVLANVGGSSVPVPASWPGKCLLVTTPGTLNLLPDDNYVAVLTTVDSPPGAPIFTFNLPPLSTMVGTIAFVSVNPSGHGGVNDLFYNVNSQPSEFIVNPNFYSGILPPNVTTIVEGIGGGSNGCLALYAPSKDNAQNWIRMRLNLVGVN